MPRTQLSYCPACGVRGLVHDHKKVNCPTCHLELYFNPGTAVCALLTNAKKELLVVIRAQEPEKGAWDLPGGFVDPGEAAEQAIQREIREELNVEPQGLSYLCSAANTQYHYKGVTYQTTDLAFVGTVEHPCNIVAADDVAQYLWVSPQDIDIARFGFGSIRQVVKYYVTTLS